MKQTVLNVHAQVHSSARHVPSEGATIGGREGTDKRLTLTLTPTRIIPLAKSVYRLVFPWPIKVQIKVHILQRVSILFSTGVTFDLLCRERGVGW